MEKHKIGDSIIEIVQGDITKQSDIEAIVNAANAHLRIGGGVAGAIHRAAGPELELESIKHAPIEPGEAVITGGHDLNNKYVIHCLGPVYNKDKPHEKLLADCYINALKICDERNINSIAFPAISTGIFGYPIEEATEIALKQIIECKEILNFPKIIRLVLFSDNDHEVYIKTIKKLL